MQATIIALALIAHSNPQGGLSHRQLVSATCFKTGEQSSGMNKICYYNCLGSAAAVTVASYELCPLTIER